MTDPLFITVPIILVLSCVVVYLFLKHRNKSEINFDQWKEEFKISQEELSLKGAEVKISEWKRQFQEEQSTIFSDKLKSELEKQKGELKDIQATIAKKEAIADLEEWKRRFQNEQNKVLDLKLKEGIKEWKDKFQEEIKAVSFNKVQNELKEWKKKEIKNISQEAIKKSKAIRNGKTLEHFLPFSEAFSYNPIDTRFLGSPIDLIVFDGLDQDDVDKIVFIEIKTGSSNLSTRERRVRDAIKEGRVEWEEIRITTANSTSDNSRIQSR